MNITVAARFSFLTILFLAGAFFTGCETAPPINWDSRVGNYTYDQAVKDFGPPDRQTKLSDGQTVAKWITRTYNTGGSYNVGMGYYGNAGYGAGQKFGPGSPDSVFQLTFNTDGKLAAWSKNY